MEKISYRLVHNRKNSLNDKGMALIQVEAYYKKKKIYFSTHIYVTPEQWDKKQHGRNWNVGSRGKLYLWSC